jgi:hypothetical protein
MPRIVKALDFRDDPPGFELTNGNVVQIAYFDAAGWTAYQAWVEAPADETRLRAMLQAAAPTADLEVLNQYASWSDLMQIVSLAKGHAPEIMLALKNGASGADAGEAVSLAPSTPPSSPTTTSPTSSPGSPARTGGRSRKSTTSAGTPRSQPSTG